MKWILIFVMTLSISADAQQKDKDLQSLIEAERAFSRMAGEKSTIEAFVHYFAPNSILVEKGQEINGLEFYKKQSKDSSLIIWEPVFADIASSKDFGYTTGPARFYKSKNDTAVLGGMYYSSAWEKGPDGEWKVIFDLGSALAEPTNPGLKTSAKLLDGKNKQAAEAAIKNVLQLDKIYVDNLNSKNTSFDVTYFSEEARIHRPRVLPVIGRSAITAYQDPKDRVYTFKQLGARVAKSGDMAFTYGGLDVNNKQTKQTANVRYFRIWKKEGNDWKIVLDVMG